MRQTTDGGLPEKQKIRIQIFENRLFRDTWREANSWVPFQGLSLSVKTQDSSGNEGDEELAFHQQMNGKGLRNKGL